jgi:hypothetical protein
MTSNIRLSILPRITKESYLFISTNVPGQETPDFTFFPVPFAVDRSVGRGEGQQRASRFSQQAPSQMAAVPMQFPQFTGLPVGGPVDLEKNRTVNKRESLRVKGEKKGKNGGKILEMHRCKTSVD